MPSLQSIIENLVRSEAQFLAAAGAIPANQWKTSPGEGRWSAGELVCHLIQVETAIVKNTAKVLHRPPQPRPLLKRFHFPMALVESRLIPRKTPIPLDPSLVGEKDQMLVQLRAVRQRTRVFMEETQEKGPKKISHAPSLSGHLQPLRMVPGDRFASGKALKTDARDCRSSSKNRNNFA